MKIDKLFGFLKQLDKTVEKTNDTIEEVDTYKLQLQSGMKFLANALGVFNNVRKDIIYYNVVCCN